MHEWHQRSFDRLSDNDNYQGLQISPDPITGGYARGDMKMMMRGLESF